MTDTSGPSGGPLWDRLTEEERDRLRVLYRKALPVLQRMCAAVDRYQAAGIDQAERHANGSPDR